MNLPYWDWTNDNDSDPAKQRGSVWSVKFMGGRGSPVTNGPFADGLWKLADGTSLFRELGTSTNFGSLPTDKHVKDALAIEGFDCPNFAQAAGYGPAELSVASPPAPSLAGAAGGSLPGGVYRVTVTYINARGETRPSAESTICLGGGCTPGNTFTAIRVDSPPARPTATQYRVFVTAAGGTTGTETLQAGPTAIGTASTINAIVPGAAPPTMNSTASFRNAVEGFHSPLGRPAEMHNRVHMWVGGSMAPGTSPDDPIFFLHHCNVDRIWALWQFLHPGQNYPITVPTSTGVGTRPHGLNDPMPPWTAAPEIVAPKDLLNHTKMSLPGFSSYTYDSDPPGASINVSP